MRSGEVVGAREEESIHFIFRPKTAEAERKEGGKEEERKEGIILLTLSNRFLFYSGISACYETIDSHRRA